MPASEEVFEVARGRDDSFTVSLFDEDGEPAGFGPLDALDASVWVGGSEAEAYSPGAIWSDAAAGVIAMTTTAAGTASLAPGAYPVEIFVAPYGTSLKIRAAEFWMRVVDSPGADVTSLPVYCSYQDLRDNGGGVWLDLLRRDGLANCLRERAKARAWVDGLVLGAHRPMDPRGTYRYVGLAGATNPDQADPTLSDLLDAGGLVVSPRIVELASLKALEYVCRSRLTFESGDLWASRYSFFSREANRLALSTVATVRDAPGNDLYAFRLGVCSLR